MSTKHAVVFANGEIRSCNAAKKLAESASILIAADGGLKHLLNLGLHPDFLVGDLDSVNMEQVSLVEALGCKVYRFPMDKDETDLELALLTAADSGCDKITVVAALGGRLDQTLSNLYLLNLPQLSELDLRMDDGKEEVFLIHKHAEIEGTSGDTISLLPISPVVNGVVTVNLKYPLVNEKLVFCHSRGISNVMLTRNAQVDIESGILLCIHTRNGVLI